MRRLQLTSAALVPHAPLLLDGIGPDDPQRAALRDAAVAPALDAEVTVVLSPHGPRTGVYLTAHGSLDAQGLKERTVAAKPNPQIAADLAGLWGVPTIDGPLDHGATVAMLLAGIDGPVVVACLHEITGPTGADGHRAIADGRSFAEAVRKLDGPPADLVASAHSGAALTARAPLGYRPRARELEDELRNAIETDPARLGSVAVDLWREAGSCGPGVFVALGELVAGPGKVTAYGAPHGVGYLIASFPT